LLEIVEKYVTISGEAPIIGKPIYLIRFSGCNLSCVYCDTSIKEQVNIVLTEQDLRKEIVHTVKKNPKLAILFTGGEPLLEKRHNILLKIIKSLSASSFYIETNGSIPLLDLDLPNCHYVVDWKTPSAGNKTGFALENLDKLRPEKDCLKLVVQPSDLKWIKNIINKILGINPLLSIFLSPQWGKMDLAELATYIIKNHLPVSMSIQLHKIIWGSKQRGM